MKKWLIVAFTLLTLSILKTTTASPITYPFESITIKSAYTFNVEIAQPIDEASFLYENTAVGEQVSVYVGELEFVENNEAHKDSSYLIVVTNEAGDDLVRWLINSYSKKEEGETFEFSSHKTIVPGIGVQKTHEDDPSTAKVTITEVDVETNTSNYQLTDNTHKTYDMIPSSLEIEDDLSIVISTYNEGE